MSGHCRWCEMDMATEVQLLNEDGTVEWAHMACETLQKPCEHDDTTTSTDSVDAPASVTGV